MFATGSILLLHVWIAGAAPPAEPEAAPPHTETVVGASTLAPFAFGDFSWLNGNNRQTSALLETPYITPFFLFDGSYTFDFNRPIDHTIVGTTITGRHNEFQITMASVGADFHYKNVRATLSLQYGLYATLVPRNDPSVARGQYDLANAFRYIREANAGYHWDVWNGINLDAGVFMSYIGLFSYLNYENWAYQPSYVSDNTPFFFQGLRLQMFPTDRLKVEIWVTNGWQSYAEFNESPGFGFQFLWRPVEWLSFVANGYYGYDTPNTPSRFRMLTDNSLQIRYYNNPGNPVLNRAAFSFTADFGCEGGGGVRCLGGNTASPTQLFLGYMLYGRFWFFNDRFGLTLGTGAIDNPGRYLVLAVPGPQGSTAFPQTPGLPFVAWDSSVTADYMPNQFWTFRLEYIHRHASVPYFAGHGGVTSPNGLNTTPIPAGWSPDLVKAEDRITAALLFRI